VLVVGWFGPRGLASLVFALLALEDVGSAADEAVAVIAVTVLLSVLAHGISAAPVAARYARVAAAAGQDPGDPVPDLPDRGLPRLRVPLFEEGATAPSAVRAHARQEVSDRDDHDSDGGPVG
jgi:sodium/hydrogen antiporter